ncbi:LamG-like jellyroll fold domain-containing protein [Kitasatospora sp. NPDC093679]|uniref:LamG-like jellyroll fold domain-containing protein n=1 Tax=Kitasatospora sp. NPDC093679 TaxID=3154983 RepID=UPI003443AF39
MTTAQAGHPRRARHALARWFTATALVTSASLVMAAAHAVPALPVAPGADGPGLPGYAVNGEVAHFDFEYSGDQESPNTVPNGPRGIHRNGAVVGPRTDNEAVWGIPDRAVRSLRLNGTDQYMSVPLTVPTEESFSVSAWVKPAKIGGSSYSVITEPGSRVSGFYLKINPDGRPLFGMPRGDSENTGWDTANGTAPLVADQWTHLTGVYDAAAGEIRLYVNGTRAGRAVRTATWHAQGQIEVGRGEWAGAPADGFPGRMTDVRIWQRALPDLEAADIAIADRVIRSDRCTGGDYLHSGGPKLKTMMATALNGSLADVHAATASAWGYGPAALANLEDQKDQRAIQDAELAREQAWTAVTKPFAVHGPDYVTFLNPPGYGAPVFAFLGSGATTSDGPPKPSKAALDKAVAISKERANPQGWDAYTLYANEDALKRLSAYQIARFIRQGGFPSAAPAKGSLEFRTEVEELKTQWAGCDSTDPLDPDHRLDDVVATASAEWQAEQAAQAKPRADIAAADIQAYTDLRTATIAMVEAQGQGFVVSRMLAFQKYWQGRPRTDADYPKPEKFTQAATETANAKKAISAQLAIAQKAAASAKSQADKAAVAQTEAGRTAAADGTPYGRGLTYAQQSVQVAKASAAAAQTAAKAIETTLGTVSATQADSQALYALADTQTRAAQAEFKRAAAQEAADQAKASATAAALQAEQAAKAAARAKADREQAHQAEQAAKAAADDAHAKRTVAEQERAAAAAARQRADAEHAKAAAAEARAKEQQAAAASALGTAEGAERTAAQKKDAALAAEARAAEARDAAVAAEARRDATRARQESLEAAAAAAEGTDAAQATRKAANEAKAAADQASGAATGARADADQATRAAVDARTAATQAAGAAARARSAADGAQADYTVTSAAVATAHAAVADAVAASAQATRNVETAAVEADKAAAATVKAKQAAAASRTEADQAAADSARTAGQAYAASLAALSARDAAGAAAVSGDRAVALGTPFRQTDSSAALAALIGQAGKTLAQQQADAAKARADEAAQAARDAAALAAKADAAAKAAAQAAANAAADTARAVASLQAARTSAAQAAAEAEATKKSGAATESYNGQAFVDSGAAHVAATEAKADADAADASATEAEHNAAGARQAATDAEHSAAAAKQAAANSDQYATTAEQAAANARQSAEEAQAASNRAEAKRDKEVLEKGGATGVGGMFTQQTVEPLEDPKPENECVLGMGNSGCDVTFRLRFKLTVDFYLCTDPNAGPDVTAATCPAANIVWLGDDTGERTTTITKHFSNWDITKIVDKAVLQGLWQGLTDDFVKCAHFDLGGCAWAATWLVPPSKIAKAVELIRALDASLHTGVGIRDSYLALKALGLDAKVTATIEQEVHLVEEAFTACKLNSFPAGTQVLMADGSHRAISAVRVGDLLAATDPRTGATVAEPATAIFAHTTQRLVDVHLADGGRLTSTAGHRLYVTQHGWTLASDLRAGDLLHSADGTEHAVSAVEDRDGIAAQTVFDLTVSGLQTFHVRTEGDRPQDILVHNCNNLAADAQEFPRIAHTLSEHVNVDRAEAERLARVKLERGDAGLNGVFIDEQTAQQVVDYGVADYLAKNKENRKKLSQWMANRDDTTTLFKIKGRFGANNSIGTIYFHDGRTPVAANNEYTILLKKMPGHPRGYIVSSAFPSGMG